MTLDGLIGGVQPVDDAAAAAARARHDQLVKPPGSLGLLEEVGAQLCAIAGSCPPPMVEQPALLIAAGDHGVHGRGVSPWPQEVTAAMVRTFCAGGAVSTVMADTLGVIVRVLDVGVAGSVEEHPRLTRARIRAGTRDLAATPAMTADECRDAIIAGAAAARNLLRDGADLLLTGDMGIANTTPSAAVIGAVTGAAPDQVVGRGTGIDDITLARKVEVVRAALERHGPVRDPLAVLASVGGLEHAALVGAILAAAGARVPVLLDGVTACAAALVAVGLAPQVGGYLVAGHRSAEPGATVALERLGLRPLLDLSMRLGEGTGALLAVPLVRAAAAVLRDTWRLVELQP